MKTRIIFHVDMDAFFASCEEAINPSLRNKPLVVGGTKEDKRGIVSCPNYLARAKGVRTAMPLTKAIRLVPEANFIRGTRGLYSDFSKKVLKILDYSKKRFELDAESKQFHSLISFIIRTFFFVYLGVMVGFQKIEFIFIGILILLHISCGISNNTPDIGSQKLIHRFSSLTGLL